jgi:glycosyltransferase involved in cell wall biosynthesis
MSKITFTLPTKNEERNLPRVLASVTGIVDEIVIVDSGSTDRTDEIAISHGARLFARPWTGFADQRNFAASHATYDWVLTLDADEELSPELRASLLAWKQLAPEHDAYEFHRRAFYLGGWIRHSGWYPDRHIRLYRVGCGRFEGATHDSFYTQGRVGRLRGDILHYTYDTVAEHAAKVDTYTSSAAQELFAQGRRHWRAAMYLATPWTLVHKLIVKGGMLDGRRGWHIACQSSRSTWLKFRKLGQLVREANRSQRERAPSDASRRPRSGSLPS